jgi:hypothetical protein
MRDVYQHLLKRRLRHDRPMKCCGRNQRLQTTETPGCQHHRQRIQLVGAALGVVLDERAQHLRRRVSCISRILRPDITRFATG